MPRRARAVAESAADPTTALREHLLTTAERLVEERSPTSLTTREIARAAGVSDGVLYNHFSGKDELVLAASVRRFASLLARYRSSLPQAGTGALEDNLTQIARAALELHLDLLPILGGLLSDPELLRSFTHEIHREHVGAAEIVDSIARYLAAEQSEGRVRPADPRAAADLVVGAVAVQAFMVVLGVPRRDALAAAGSRVETLVRGLEPRP